MGREGEGSLEEGMDWRVGDVIEKEVEGGEMVWPISCLVPIWLPRP